MIDTAKYTTLQLNKKIKQQELSIKLQCLALSCFLVLLSTGVMSKSMFMVVASSAGFGFTAWCIFIHIIMLMDMKIAVSNNT